MIAHRGSVQGAADSDRPENLIEDQYDVSQFMVQVAYSREVARAFPPRTSSVNVEPPGSRPRALAGGPTRPVKLGEVPEHGLLREHGVSD